MFQASQYYIGKLCSKEQTTNPSETKIPEIVSPCFPYMFFSDSGILGLQPIDFATDVHQHPVNGRQEEIPVVIAASEDRLGGAIAAINSVHRNTRSNVIFYIVTLNSTADHLR